jgi:hypothetical protein
MEEEEEGILKLRSNQTEVVGTDGKGLRRVNIFVEVNMVEKINSFKYFGFNISVTFSLSTQPNVGSEVKPQTQRPRIL